MKMSPLKGEYIFEKLSKMLQFYQEAKEGNEQQVNYNVSSQFLASCQQ